MPSFIYKKRFYGNFFIRKAISLSVKITELFDDRKDRKICGCSLVKYVPSLYRESMGATGSHSTCYWTLDKVLKDAAFDSSDAFIDVGCGKGRVLAYMIGKGYSFSLTDVELRNAAFCFDCILSLHFIFQAVAKSHSSPPLASV